jgi:putative peptidoglycan lipid II flippase
MQIPETLVGTAMGVVIFPTLAALSTVGNIDGKRDAMSGALRFILIATIPSAIGLVLVGRPLISLLERGAMDASASALVYSTLQFFAIGIIFHSLLEVVARSFYADKDTYTPLWAAVGGAAINIVCAILFSGVLSSNPADPHGYVGGLALANTLGVTFEVAALAWLLRRRWRGLNENTLAMTTFKTLASSLAMGVVIVILEALFQRLGLTERGFIWTVIALGIEVVVGVIVFVGVALALKMDELRTLIALVLRRGRMPSPTASTQPSASVE